MKIDDIVPMLSDEINDFNNAVIIATFAHLEQVDKAGANYILHPINVVSRVRGIKRQLVAMMHDVVEDTSITLDDLRPFFSDEIINALDGVTRRKDETYKEYIIRCKGNHIATDVKLADLDHNSLPERYTHIEPQKGYSMRMRYSRAKQFLLDN